MEDGRAFDGDGKRLELVGGVWHASSCVATDEECAATPVPVSAARNKRIVATLAAGTSVREPMPAFMAPYLSREIGESRSSQLDKRDFTSLLGATMAWYIEWPHVDEPFDELLASLPGYGTYFHDRSSSADEQS